ncbi:DUF3108 domain-containing protein [Acidovorax sp. 1608163]|uniref:DUF3108 domain-containing protein n=1 Tax=Acidovorax sp. 1608163 TaxID=2478662 RepID=UPI000EF6A773|nr:DUF3108 domain-containing protein [Acidovorax sp. 1608163]AYM97910.1 DUF3108 domain-containing protein [Acidovorax sp. 1608163]
MPRRTLLALTALVLALHWLVLHGIPLAWEGPTTPAGKVFSTRSVAAPPPAAALPPPSQASPAATPAAAPQAAKPRPAPPKRPPAHKAPTPSGQPPEPADATLATDTAGDGPAAADPAANAELWAGGANAPGTPASAAAPDMAAPAASAPQPAASAPPAQASAEGSGVDITPPGGQPGESASTAAPPVRLPAPVKLAFDVAGQAKKFDYQARAELVWQHDGARYEARQEISAFLVGSRTQRSTGMVTPQGLQPERFGDRNRSERAAHFDYARGRVTFSANTPEAAVGPGAQDRLSVFIQLAGLLAATPERFVPGTQLTLTTVSATSADRWTFTVEAPETLTLPAGTLPTLKLQRLPRRDYDQKAELWLAPSMGYLPVRIKITQANGDFADLRLRASGPP